MRSRDRVLQSLENVYREAFQSAEGRDDKDEMARLVPDMNLAISPRGQGGELTLTWTF